MGLAQRDNLRLLSLSVISELTALRMFLSHFVFRFLIISRCGPDRGGPINLTCH
jgi:hypothetical protein